LIKKNAAWVRIRDFLKKNNNNNKKKNLTDPKLSNGSVQNMLGL